MEPQRQAAVNKAAEHAQSVVDQVHADLAKHDWDLKKAAPRPHWSEQNTYRGEIALRHHNFYRSLSHHDHERNRATGNIGSMNDKNHYVKPRDSYVSTSTGGTVHHPPAELRFRLDERPDHARDGSGAKGQACDAGHALVADNLRLR